MNESESINLKGGNEKVGDTKSLIFELFDYISSLGAIEKRDVHVCVFMTFRQLLSILVLSLFTKLRKLFVGRYHEFINKEFLFASFDYVQFTNISLYHHHCTTVPHQFWDIMMERGHKQIVF